MAGQSVGLVAYLTRLLRDARQRVATVDSRGLAIGDRPGLEDFKAAYARSPGEVAAYECRDRARITLVETIRNFKPTILIGTSGTAGLLRRS